MVVAVAVAAHHLQGGASRQRLVELAERVRLHRRQVVRREQQPEALLQQLRLGGAAVAADGLDALRVERADLLVGALVRPADVPECVECVEVRRGGFDAEYERERAYRFLVQSTHGMYTCRGR